jgi:hypothetical protein
MALTDLQRYVCRLLATRRKLGGESYVAGGAALNELLQASRLSRDIDVFHDSDEALAASWESDRRALEADGLEVEVLRERGTYVEARISRHGDSVLIEWARDSAYRFFPLVEHDDLGLTLHPFDLATNKTLALVGRLEVRDWVDVLSCHSVLQPLGYLAWAACGKDPGFGPSGILEEASRSARYSREEVDALSFDGPAPDATELAQRWRKALLEARRVVALLPPDRMGQVVLTDEGELCRDEPTLLEARVRRDRVRFHSGSIRGAWPRVRGA